MRRVKRKSNSESKSLLSYYNFTFSEQKKYPVVAGILKQLTPERIKKEIEEVKKVELPPELQKWVREYEKVGKRDDYIWKWAYLGWQIFTLSCVDKRYKNLVIMTKMHSTILNALVDDLADAMHNQELLSTASGIISSNINKNSLDLYNTKKKNYIFLIKRLWNLIDRNIKRYPKYKKFKDIFKYDYQQYLNTIQYSYLINKDPALINLTEHEIYSSHNMQMIIGSTIDLMCSSKFNIGKLGAFREVIWNAQQMGRIGNLIATWKDEIFDDSDFTSGIFAYVLDKNIINVNNLQKNGNSKKIIEKIASSEAEKYFLKKWEDYYNNNYNLSKDIKSVEISKILEGSKEFLIMHLTSRGLEV